MRSGAGATAVGVAGLAAFTDMPMVAPSPLSKMA
jgi:hypothetical protein